MQIWLLCEPSLHPRVWMKEGQTPGRDGAAVHHIAHLCLQCLPQRGQYDEPDHKKSCFLTNSATPGLGNDAEVRLSVVWIWSEWEGWTPPPHPPSPRQPSAMSPSCITRVSSAVLLCTPQTTVHKSGGIEKPRKLRASSRKATYEYAWCKNKKATNRSETVEHEVLIFTWQFKCPGKERVIKTSTKGGNTFDCWF